MVQFTNNNATRLETRAKGGYSRPAAGRLGHHRARRCLAWMFLLGAGGLLAGLAACPLLLMSRIQRESGLMATNRLAELAACATVQGQLKEEFLQALQAASADAPAAREPHQRLAEKLDATVAMELQQLMGSLSDPALRRQDRDLWGRFRAYSLQQRQLFDLLGRNRTAESLALAHGPLLGQHTALAGQLEQIMAGISLHIRDQSARIRHWSGLSQIMQAALTVVCLSSGLLAALFVFLAFLQAGRRPAETSRAG